MFMLLATPSGIITSRWRGTHNDRASGIDAFAAGKLTMTESHGACRGGIFRVDQGITNKN
ncbi:MAG: hypothetical protein A2Y62_10480 [Candidatus Fischerbacteria bacterium RBG_13_37_8]|uniref:Uncharacterized protein n=1 Tax=Candidatus Fischerbacteria bacterium RBG_13_37_8 TaxID=1817863 RepID=A0A1F5VNW6_9BACT|nr:MAG: hypothetical protein A2Y62_10480 [Candidatus Fischerbacteria bacterium RBG_13_37_8]